jgi:hypothetical protein
LLLDLLLVLTTFVLQLLKYRVIYHHLASVVETKLHALGRVLLTLLSCGLGSLLVLKREAHLLSIDALSNIKLLLLERREGGETFLASAPKELALEEFAAVGVRECCGVVSWGTFGLPVDLS